MLRLVLTLAMSAMLLLTGCSGRAVSPFSGLSPVEVRALADRMARDREAALQADLREAFALRQPRHVLMLSGGDADGAFGCGVLAGWHAAVSDPRPQFDVVTGVSTGALMATFAFLGEASDDQTLRNVYTNLRDEDVMEGPFTIGPANSVMDTAPLQRLIARHVTDEVIGRVAAAHRQGRRLYVATVELDSGAAVVWPMSKMAADAVAGQTVDRAGADRFRKVLLAAASIPVVFPPVEIDGGLHVDAGIKEAIFLRQAMLGIRNAYAAGKGDAVNPPTVWAIVNAKLRSAPTPVSDDLLHIGIRSLELYTQSLQIFNLRDAAHLAALHQPAFRFRWVAEPENSPEKMQGGLFSPMFDPAAMGALYWVGDAIGRSASGAWREGAPALDSDPMEARATKVAAFDRGRAFPR